MQTVRKYAYLIVLGLVAALVSTNTLSKIIFQTSETILPNIGEIARQDLTVGTYVLGFILVLIAFMVVRNAVFGIPRKFVGSIKKIRRRVTVLLIVAIFGAMFLVV